MTGQHLRYPGHDNVLGLAPEQILQPGRIILASSLAIVADLVGAIVIFEAISRRVTSTLFLRLWTTAALVMLLDSVVFTTLAFAPRPAYWTILASGLVAKLAGATFYAALMAWYATTFEQPQTAPAGADRRGDVFSWLTYRQRYEEARTLMARDALTGLYNRGYFDEAAPRQLAHAGRARHEMSLVLVDIDRLKAANDRYGHEAGDELVRSVADEIRQMVRTSDVGCRYSGDEFAVVLTNAVSAAAATFAGRLAPQRPHERRRAHAASAVGTGHRQHRHRHVPCRRHDLARPAAPRRRTALRQQGPGRRPCDRGQLKAGLRRAAKAATPSRKSALP